jgi:general secretion pathway protein D
MTITTRSRTLPWLLLAAALGVPLTSTAQPAPARAAAAPGAPGETAAARSRSPVTLNFVNAEVEAVTRAFAAMIGRQIAVDPRVKGAITVYSEQPISVRDAYLTYLSALRGMGAAMVETGGLLKVVPEADAKVQTGTVSVGEAGPRGDQIVTQIFNLQHQNPNNLVAVLRPLITANNTINANPGSNSLVITDYADNLRRLAQIIAALDRPSDLDLDLIPLKHAVASDIVALVQRLVGASAGPVAPAAAATQGGQITVLAEPRSNALIVRAPNAARLAQVRAVIAQLDVPSAGAGPAGGIWVVTLKNADAVRLATVLRAAFAGSGGTGGAAGGGIGAAGPTAPAPAAPAVGGTAGASAQATAPVSSAAAPTTGGFIQADPATNSLIVSAPEPLYRQVRAMIDQLDVRRAQVYIESMIVEVGGDNAADFGFQWQGLLGKDGDNNIISTGTNFSGRAGGNIIDINLGAVAGSLTTNPLGEGFNIGLVRNFGGTYALAAIARVLQSQAQTNIVSTPNLITLDNEEAKIVVGENVPFITGQFTNTGGATTSPFQTIERKDVGITLRIRPQIGESGTVRMTIYQEQSSVKDTAAVGTSNAGPSTTKRSIESQVVVDDGQIIVLGGLIEDRFIENKSKVPLLGDIPYLGALFRSESRERRRTNLMVFLRPVVMRDQDSASRLSLDRWEELRQQQKDSQPTPNPVLPVGEAPVLPPMRPAPAASTPR